VGSSGSSGDAGAVAQPPSAIATQKSGATRVRAGEEEMNMNQAVRSPPQTDTRSGYPASARLLHVAPDLERGLARRLIHSAGLRKRNAGIRLND